MRGRIGWCHPGAAAAEHGGRRGAALLALAVLACSAPPAFDTSPDDLREPAAPTIVQLDPYVGRLMTTEVVVGGQDTLRLLFDTGGGQTLLSPTRAESLTCGDPGWTVGYRMSGERVEWPTCGGATIDLADARLGPIRYGVWDVGALLPPELPPLDGVLSLDAFRGRRVTIDLASPRIILETEASFLRRVDGMEEVPARAATGQDGGLLSIFLRVDLEGAGPVWLLLDSANLDAVVVSDRRTLPGDSATIRLGGLELRAAVSSRPLVHDGALSEEVVRAAKVTLDLVGMRAWVGVAARE